MPTNRIFARCSLLLAAVLCAAGCNGAPGDGVFFIPDAGDASGTEVDENFPGDEVPDDEAPPLFPLDTRLVVSVHTADNDHNGRHELYSSNPHGSFTSLSAPLDDQGDTNVSEREYEYVPADPADVPGGEYVLFTATGSNQGVYTTPPGVADLTKVSRDTEQDARAATASPDGTLILYLAGDPEHLSIVRPDGSGHRILHDLGRVFTTGWASNGSWVLLTTDAESSSQYELTAMRPDGTAEAQISRTAAPAGTPRFVPFAVSPTENRVIFRSDAAVAGQYELFTFDLDSTAPPTLIEGATTTTSPLAADWTRDGESILILKRDGGATDLLVAAKDGGPTANLTGNIPGRVVSYLVSPDSTSVAFRVSLDGVYAGDLANEPVQLMDSALVGSYGWSPDGTQVFIIGTNGFQPPQQLWVARASQAMSARPASEPDEEVLAATFMDNRNVMVLSDIAGSGTLQTEQEYGTGQDMIRVHRRTLDSSTLPLGVEVQSASVVWEPVDAADFAEVSSGDPVGLSRTEIKVDIAGELLTFRRHAAHTLKPNVADPYPVVYSEADSWTGNDVGTFSTQVPSSVFLRDASGHPLRSDWGASDCAPDACELTVVQGDNFVALAPTFSNDQISFKVTAVFISIDPVACLVLANQYRLTGVQPSRGPCTAPIKTQETGFPQSEWTLVVEEPAPDSARRVGLGAIAYDPDNTVVGDALDVIPDGPGGFTDSMVIEYQLDLELFGDIGFQ